MNGVKKISIKVSVANEYLKNKRDEDIKIRIKQMMTRNLADFMISNLDTIPHKIKKEVREDTLSYEETLTFCIVDCDEYHILKTVMGGKHIGQIVSMD